MDSPPYHGAVPTIETLVPAARQADETGLRDIDPDTLARYVADRSHPWWRREPCARALAGRVPDRWLATLVDRVRDREDAGVVRIALLDALAADTPGDTAGLLPWLQHSDRENDTSYGVPEAVLLARARLGDRTALRELVTLANDPWRRRRKIGATGIDALVDRYGAAEIVAGLDRSRPEDRALEVRLRHRDGGDVTDALADPDVGVAHLAYTLAGGERRLRAFLDTAPTVDARLWAMCALHNRGVDATADYDRLGRPRVEIPGLDEELRAVIRTTYVPKSQPTTDPRWRVEAVCAAPAARPDAAAHLTRAMAALAGAGLSPAPPVPCGEFFGSGGGTYHVIDAGDGTVEISTLGPYFTGHAGNEVAVRALVAAGFRLIDAELSAVRIDGLHVYYFGDRGPLTVGALLFYWQD